MELTLGLMAGAGLVLILIGVVIHNKDKRIREAERHSGQLMNEIDERIEEQKKLRERADYWRKCQKLEQERAERLERRLDEVRTLLRKPLEGEGKEEKPAERDWWITFTEKDGHPLGMFRTPEEAAGAKEVIHVREVKDGEAV